MKNHFSSFLLLSVFIGFLACKNTPKNQNENEKMAYENRKDNRNDNRNRKDRFEDKNLDNSNSDAAVDNKGKTTFLFDATKDEMAGNADWIIDADKYDRYGEANPNRFPTPAATKINQNSNESFWKGALSAWGVDLVKMGYGVETLPANGKITYGDAQNPQDLKNYKVFVVCEPNTRFEEDEKKALMNFIKNGGGLFMIADHDRSDRNRDNWDSPKIWNDFMQKNSVENNVFGFSFDLQNHSDKTNNFANDPAFFNGKAGNASRMEFHSGTSMTLIPNENNQVKGLIYKKSASLGGEKNAMMLRSIYGKGRVVALGDSSPPDDGSGDSKDKLYNGWNEEVNGDHARIILNASVWLAN